jgi:hypothetical protein
MRVSKAARTTAAMSTRSGESLSSSPWIWSPSRVAVRIRPARGDVARGRLVVADLGEDGRGGVRDLE